MEAVIFTGIQGSGKTTFYEERFASTHARISLDVLGTRTQERAALTRCLATRAPFVIDNTNPRAADRAVYIAPAKAAGFRVTSYYFDTELKDALRRNRKRAGKAAIPTVGVIATRKRLEAPSPAEGFDALYVVRLDEARGFTVEPWKSEAA